MKPLKPFKFKQFTVQQTEGVFGIGTDAVLLGALTDLPLSSAKVLEVGSGTGIVSLMLAQRFPEASFLAIDIQANAAELAAENFKNSPFGHRMEALLADFKTWKTAEKYDAVVCNPPYFLPNPSEKLPLARQQRSLTLEDFIAQATEVLTEQGTLHFIFPAREWGLSENTVTENNLHLTRILNIYGREGGKMTRQIISLSHSPARFYQEDFTVEKSPRCYSEQYLEATREFHLFSGAANG